MDVMSFSDCLSYRAKIKELESEVAKLKKTIRHKSCEVSHLKSKYGLPKKKTKKSEIIDLIEKGLTPSQIKDAGFDYQYAHEIWRDYNNAIRK